MIVITGSAIRVGKMLSLSLKEAKLILHYHSSQNEAFELQKILLNQGCECHLFQANLKNRNEITDLFEFVKTIYGRVDILINNAALFEKKPFLEIVDFDSTFDVNLKAPLICSQLAAKLMPPHSSIINICDCSSNSPFKNYPLHSISKSALKYATEVLAKELAPKIRVNALLLGMVLPSPGFDEKQTLEICKKHVLNERLLKDEEIVHALHFLIHNTYINAATLSLDGGQK